MGQFFNHFNRTNEQRGDVFFESGHFGAAAQFYKTALDEIQGKQHRGTHTDQDIDRIQKKILTCFQLKTQVR